jgi:hypothetical protein
MVSAQFSNSFIKPPPPFLTFARVHVSKERLYWFFILKKSFAYLGLCNHSPIQILAANWWALCEMLTYPT